MKKITLSILVLASFAMSCKKDNPAPIAADLLAKTWKLTGQTIGTPQLPSGQDVYNLLPDCEKDNKFIFTKDGKFTEDEGAAKCSSTDPQTIDTGVYSLLQNNTMLKFALIDTTFTVAINQLNSSTLKFTATTNVNGLSLTQVSTFTAQ